MKIIILFLVISSAVSIVIKPDREMKHNATLADTCGGNCPQDNCDTCPCGSSSDPVSISYICQAGTVLAPAAKG